VRRCFRLRLRPARRRCSKKHCRGDSTADIPDYGGFTGQEAEYINGVDAGIDATDDHRLHRRHDLQVCGEATAGEGLVALGLLSLTNVVIRDFWDAFLGKRL